jgi:mannose-6-phosphate isomerase-like protein (cupin superfamily)
MTEEEDWGQDGWAVQPGKGELIQLGGPHRPEILVRGGEVDGALGAFVFHHDVITENPPHAHHNFMKIAYILEGEYEFRVGDAEFSGGPGTTVVVPRGAYHTFLTATGGKMLFVSAPSGNEDLFVELGRLGPNPTADRAPRSTNASARRASPATRATDGRARKFDPPAEEIELPGGGRGPGGMTTYSIHDLPVRAVARPNRSKQHRLADHERLAGYWNEQPGLGASTDSAAPSGRTHTGLSRVSHRSPIVSPLVSGSVAPTVNPP